MKRTFIVIALVLAMLLSFGGTALANGKIIDINFTSGGQAHLNFTSGNAMVTDFTSASTLGGGNMLGNIHITDNWQFNKGIDFTGGAVTSQHTCFQTHAQGGLGSIMQFGQVSSDGPGGLSAQTSYENWNGSWPPHTTGQHLTWQHRTNAWQPGDDPIPYKHASPVIGHLQAYATGSNPETNFFIGRTSSNNWGDPPDVPMPNVARYIDASLKGNSEDGDASVYMAFNDLGYTSFHGAGKSAWVEDWDAEASGAGTLNLTVHGRTSGSSWANWVFFNGGVDYDTPGFAGANAAYVSKGSPATFNATFNYQDNLQFLNGFLQAGGN